MDVFDITIIGAGPTGLFGAFYAGLREMKAKIIEALPEPGGQLTTLYPEKYVYDSPGYPKILAKDLVKVLVEQAYGYEPAVFLGERVKSLRYVNGGNIELETDKGLHHSRTVLISAGFGAFSPNRLGVPGEKELDGKGVFYFVRDKEYFGGKRVLIVGAGDSAVDWALNLKDIADVTLIHRRDVFRAHERSVKELFSSKVSVKLFYELKELHGDGHVQAATILDNQTKEASKIPVDAVLLYIGYRAELGPIKDWGLELEGRSIVVNGRMETNLPRVYAAGDVITQPDAAKLNLIATGFSQAAIAVNLAKKSLDPTAPTFEHSSEKIKT